MTLWLVRAGGRGEGEDFALTNKVVGIGWPELGNLSEVRSLDGIKQRLDEQHPDAKPLRLANWAGHASWYMDIPVPMTRSPVKLATS